jgi:hypothetical protein
MSYAVEQTICAEGAHEVRAQTRKSENALDYRARLPQPDLSGVSLFNCVTHISF